MESVYFHCYWKYTERETNWEPFSLRSYKDNEKLIENVYDCDCSALDVKIQKEKRKKNFFKIKMNLHINT